MSNLVEGFQNQVWRVFVYEGNDEKSERRIPLEEATQAQVIALVESIAKEWLTAEEASASPNLFRARVDERTGRRVTITAGENPHVAASLWRADELES